MGWLRCSQGGHRKSVRLSESWTGTNPGRPPRRHITQHSLATQNRWKANQCHLMWCIKQQRSDAGGPVSRVSNISRCLTDTRLWVAHVTGRHSLDLKSGISIRLLNRAENGAERTSEPQPLSGSLLDPNRAYLLRPCCQFQNLW